MNHRVTKNILERIAQTVADAVSEPVPAATLRHIRGRIELPGKATAVIGMRRAGKTTFLHQLRGERLKRDIARERLP